MTILTPLSLFLGAACMTAVLKSRPQEDAVTYSTAQNPNSNGWHESVPESERYESVRVIPGFTKRSTLTARLMVVGGLRWIKVSKSGKVIERRIFSARAQS
jgi:hypothetical protein